MKKPMRRLSPSWKRATSAVVGDNLVDADLYETLLRDYGGWFVTGFDYVVEHGSVDGGADVALVDQRD